MDESLETTSKKGGITTRNVNAYLDYCRRNSTNKGGIEMRNRMIVVPILCAAVLVVALLSSASAKEPEPRTLSYAFYYGMNHPQAIPTIAWTKKIEQETNGRIKFKIYPGATLISPTECFEELKKGVADLTTLTVAYSPHGFPIHKGTFAFYYGVPDDTVRRRMFKYQIAPKFPEILDEFKEVKIVRLNAGSNYQLISIKPVRTLDDLKGMTIKATGDLANFIKACGGEGIPMPMSEVYMALQKGTIDGCLAPYETLKAFKFAEAAKYVTILDLTGSPYPSEAMNLDTWNSLPPDIQNIMSGSQEWWALEYERVQREKDMEGIDFAKQQGVEFIKPSAQELNKFYEKLHGVCLDAAKRLDKMGFRGSEIFSEVRRLLDPLPK
jgi:TRAP-type C4-dicarboxylate transport system substrate-binding protein